MFEFEQIEVVPLTMMRGRTFNNCYILADELQNAEQSEIRMLMTRIGDNCKLVMTGDITQSDLPPYQRGAFRWCFNEMDEVEGIKCVTLYPEDIVRNNLIAKIEAVFNRKEFKPDEAPVNWRRGYVGQTETILLSGQNGEGSLLRDKTGNSEIVGED